MKPITFQSAAIITLLVAAPALAGPISFAGGGGMGGGHRPGGRGPGMSVDAVQNRFEDQLADIMSAYDEGVAGNEDYYSTDDYTDLIGETEWLVDSYDWFLTSVERTIEHIDDYIASANDELTFYDELLAKYEARDDLSETRLERIVDWITSAQDMLSLQIDLLTYKQTTLEENLTTYTTFQTDLTSYLDEIVAAGGGTATTDDGTDDADAALQALALTGMGGCSALGDGAVTAVTAVPEPSAAASLLTIGAAAAWRAYRRRLAGV